MASTTHLPLVRMSGSVLLPAPNTMNNAIRISTTVEAASFLVDKFQTKYAQFLRQGNQSAQEFEANSREHLDKASRYEAALHKATEEAWKGHVTEGLEEKFSAILRGLPAAAVTASAEFMASRKVRIDFAMSDEAEFLRGYSVDNQSPNNDEIATLDELFNAWLMSQNLSNQEGVIYLTNESGERILDKNEQYKRILINDFRKKFLDSQSGFASFLKQKGQYQQAELVEQTHPKAAQAASPE